MSKSETITNWIFIAIVLGVISIAPYRAVRKLIREKELYKARARIHWNLYQICENGE